MSFDSYGHLSQKHQREKKCDDNPTKKSQKFIVPRYIKFIKDFFKLSLQNFTPAYKVYKWFLFWTNLNLRILLYYCIFVQLATAN